MPWRLWVCLNEVCSNLLFKAPGGICPRCGQHGHEVPLKVHRTE